MIEINNNLYVILLLVFYVMGVYRMAYMIAEDIGPLGIFKQTRKFIKKIKVNYRFFLDANYDVDKEPLLKKFKMYTLKNLRKGIKCVNCTGVWSAIILAVPLCFALFYLMWSLPLVILGGAGIQHYLTHK